MQLNKIIIFVIYLFLIGIVFSIEIKKSNSINYIRENINISLKPYHFLTKSLYFFDMSYITKDLNKSLFYLSLSKSFLNDYNAPQINEAKKIIDNILKTHKFSPQEHTRFANLINNLSLKIYKSNLENSKKLKTLVEKIDKNSLFIELLIVFLILLITAVLILLKSYRKIKENYYKDFLTEAFNRKKFFEILKTLPENYHTVVMMDIDHFKSINDSFGHEKGDFILKEVVKIIKKNIREEDFVFRWGGEEFLILFKNVNADKAYKIVKKIKKLIEETDFNGIKITASFGIKECQDSITQEDLIIVDKALYKAKEKRNDIVIV